MAIELASAAMGKDRPPLQKAAAPLKRVIIDTGLSGPDSAIVRQISKHLLDSLASEKKLQAISSYSTAGKDFEKDTVDVFDVWRAATLYAQKNPIDYMLGISTISGNMAGPCPLALFYNSEPSHAETMYSSIAAYAHVNGYLLDGKCGREERDNAEHSLLRVPLLSVKGLYYPALRIESDFAFVRSLERFACTLKDQFYKILKIE